MQLGENIRLFRQAANYTQKQLAQKCGVAEITIRQYENGKREPKKEMIERIAAALNVSPVLLYMSSDIKMKRVNKDGSLTTVASGPIEINSEWRKMQHTVDEFIQNSPTERYKKVLNQFKKLSLDGQDKAIEQVELLTRIPEYKDPKNFK